MIGLAGNDGVLGGIFSRAEGAFGLVESQFRLAAALIGPVALEATVGQDRADVAIESKVLASGRLRRENGANNRKAGASDYLSSHFYQFGQNQL